MKKTLFFFALAGWLVFSPAIRAQESGTARLLETKPAVTEGKKLAIGHLMDQELYAGKPSMLRWNSNMKDPFCIYVKNDTLHYFSPEKGYGILVTLEDLKQDSLFGSHKELGTFPSVFGITDNHVFLACPHLGVAYNYKKKKSEVFSSLPKGATNFDIDPPHTQLAFTKDNNLFFLQKKMRFAISRTPDTGTVVGHAVYRNEFGIEKGTFWSNSGKYLAYYVMDESMVQKYPITNYLSDPIEIDPIRYPEAGHKMHNVWVDIFNTETYQIHYLEPYASPDTTYITSVTWSPDDTELYAVILDRSQKNLTMVCFDVASGKLKRKLFSEHSDIYVEPEAGIAFRPGHPDQFVWMSERSGYNHIYLYNTQGKLIKAVTPADQPWMVTSWVGFSPDGKTAYFMATKDSPLQENLYSVDMKNGKIERLTKADGKHSVQMHVSGKYFIDSYTSSEMGRRTQVIDNKGNVITVLQEEKDPMAEYVCPEYRIYTLKAADGKTDLYGRMILPPDFDSARKYPVLVYVYGGPHAQLITDSYNYGSGTFLRFMAQQGYIVWTLDSRGSDMRGFAFESAIHRHVGDNESADQMKGVEFLKSLPYVDPERIGVDGWSYGGFMTLTLKTRYPDVFKVATAGGPVINWEWYEVMYGERYMGTPQDNPEGYANANLLNRVDSIRGKVMVIQGGLDPVVTPKNAISFIQKCIQKNIPIDFFLYPNHEHNVLGPQRDHLFEKLYEYYRRNL